MKTVGQMKPVETQVQQRRDCEMSRAFRWQSRYGSAAIQVPEKLAQRSRTRSCCACRF